MATKTPTERLAGRRVAIAGKLLGMSKRDAGKLVREQGGSMSDRCDATVDVIVVGDEELPLGELGEAAGLFDEEVRAAAEAGKVEIISETQLWHELGLVEEMMSEGVRRLYTPAMLADLLKVPVAVVRRWHRRGLITPAREVRRLPYFDYQEVATARRLARLLADGISVRKLESQLASLARLCPGVERPLAQLSVIVEGKHLLLRQGDGLIDSGGQFRFDFEGIASDRSRPEDLEAAARPASLPTPQVAGATTSDDVLRRAAELEDEGSLVAAAEAYRALLAATGPSAEVNFRLAELLYRMGEVSAARERYYMVIELDEDYVEARANLGCVLCESGERELAIAAFEGALRFHQDYPDVHYHLARLLDDLGRDDEADSHWRFFLELAPESPWAQEARARLMLKSVREEDRSDLALE